MPKQWAKEDHFQHTKKCESGHIFLILLHLVFMKTSNWVSTLVKTNEWNSGVWLQWNSGVW